MRDGQLSRRAWVRARRPLAERSEALELLDQGLVASGELEVNLADLARLNRLAGGAAASAAAIEALLRSSAGGGRRPRILDVGTGRGDVPLAFAGRGWAVVAVESDPAILEVARRETAGEPLVELLGGDGRSLPFADRAFDVAHCSLVLHHLDPASAVVLLREMSRVARHGVVVNDLRRGLLPFLAVSAAVRLLGRCRTTRHDGPLSVRRAYTTDELDALLAAAGLVTVRRSAALMPRVVTSAVRGAA